MASIICSAPRFNGSIDASLTECKEYLLNTRHLIETSIEDHRQILQLAERLHEVSPTIDELDEHIFNMEVHSNQPHDFSVETIESFSSRLDDLRSLASDIEDELESAIKICAENLKNLGNALFKESSYAASLEKYEEAISIHVDDPVYYTNAALCLQKLERYDESINRANQALEIDSNFLKGYVIRTKGYIALNKVEEAARSLEEIPSSYESQHDVVELTQSISSKAKEAGNALFKQTKYDLALSMYSLAIKLDETNHLLYSNRSACYQAQRAWKEAKDDALEVIELNNKFPKGYIHLVRCQIQLGEYDHAATTLQDATAQLAGLPDWESLKSQFIELEGAIKSAKAAATARSAASDRNRGEMLKARGNQQYQSGEYQDAIRFYSQAIGACPDEGVYYGNRAACWMMLKEYQQAINDCNQGLALEKQAGELDKLRLRIVDAMTQMGRIDEAMSFIGDYNRKRKNGEDIAWFKDSLQFQDKLNQLQTIKSNLENAKTALDKQEYSRSKRLFQQVQAAGVSEDIQLLINLGKAHLGLKELDDAAKFSQQAITVMSTRGGVKNIEAYILRGEALAGQGLTEQACKYYTAAVQLDPDNINASQRLKILRKVLADCTDVRKRIGEAMGERKYELAIAACSDGLNIDRTSLKLMAEMHYKRAQAYQQLGKIQARSPSTVAEGAATESPHMVSFRKCYQDSNSALYYDKAMINAFYMKIEALQALNRHEEAVADVSSRICLIMTSLTHDHRNFCM
jgi:stress-induced-phosphoprotein 1